MMKRSFAWLAPALLLAGAAHAQHNPPPPSGPTPGPDSGKPASIPFANFGGINDWSAAPDGKGIYIQDQFRHWYYASLIGPCINLPFTETIGVETWGFDTLDDSSTIIVKGDHCRIDHLVHSGPPPKHR